MNQRIRTRRRLSGLAAVIGAASLVVAACGDDDDTSSTAATSGAPAATTTQAPATTTASSETTDGPADTQGSATTAGDDEWQKALEAANAEGELEVWSVLNSKVMGQVEEAFETAYPEIDLTVASYSPPDVAARVDAEQASGISTVDVLMSIDRKWHALHMPDGYFAEIIGPDALAADELVRNGAPPRTDGAPVATQALYDDNTRLIVLLGPYGYAWNTDAVDKIESFESIIADDTFKGRIGIYDPNIGGNRPAHFSLLQDRYPGLFERLGALDPMIYSANGTMAEALAAGAVDVAFPMTEGAVAELPNVDFAFDTNFPPLATTQYAEVLASSESPNAAQVFVNWLMTPDGQETLCAGYASVLPNIPTASLSASDIFVFEEFDPDRTAEILAELNAALGR